MHCSLRFGSRTRNVVPTIVLNVSKTSFTLAGSNSPSGPNSRNNCFRTIVPWVKRVNVNSNKSTRFYKATFDTFEAISFPKLGLKTVEPFMPDLIFHEVKYLQSFAFLDHQITHKCDTCISGSVIFAVFPPFPAYKLLFRFAPLEWVG